MICIYAGCQCWDSVFLGTIQSLLAHALHRFRAVSSPEYDGGVADDNQHARGSVALRHVYWAHFHPHPLCHVIIQILQCKGGFVISLKLSE